MRKLTNFQKTVTCVKLSPMAGPDSAAAPRLLAGALDGHVKVRRKRARSCVQNAVFFRTLGGRVAVTRVKLPPHWRARWMGKPTCV